MQLIRRYAAYLHEQNLYLRQNKQEIDRSNEKLAYAMLGLGCLVFIPFLILSYQVESYRALSGAYICALVVLLTLFMVFQDLKEMIPSTYLIYIIYAFLVGYSTYASAFVTPNYICVIILFFLFQIPIITIDQSWRVNLVVIVFASAYLIIALPHKDPRLVSDEILNCLLFTVVGMVLGALLRRARIENLELKRLALIRTKIDDLTGLHNRKSLFEHLLELESAPAKKFPVGLLMIDIDWFKQYNDTYGHQAGDQCLQQIGTCFADFGARYDISFYRYGGEEFVGVTTAHDCEQLLPLCQALNQAVLELNIPHSRSKYHVVSISIGLTSAEQLCAQEEEKPLIQADLALYSAKHQGRNRTVCYVPGMTMQ